MGCLIEPRSTLGQQHTRQTPNLCAITPAPLFFLCLLFHTYLLFFLSAFSNILFTLLCPPLPFALLTNSITPSIVIPLYYTSTSSLISAFAQKKEPYVDKLQIELSTSQRKCLLRKWFCKYLHPWTFSLQYCMEIYFCCLSQEIWYFPMVAWAN